MAAYAALVSLINTLNNIQIHPRVSTFLAQKQIESLILNVGLLLDFADNFNSHGDSKEAQKLEAQNRSVKLFKLDWDQIAAATNYFSFSNRTQRSRYGLHVYKAVLPSGEVVAVKRHSSSSWHLEDLRNEISVLPNLQHPNIIKLHGYCIENFGVDVWRLWTEGSAIEFIDKSLDASVEDEAIRCIQVALLCIQENPDQRPLMSFVIKMLEGNEEMMQPHPPAWLNEGTNTFELNDTLER